MPSSCAKLPNLAPFPACFLDETARTAYLGRGLKDKTETQNKGLGVAQNGANKQSQTEFAARLRAVQQASGLETETGSGIGSGTGTKTETKTERQEAEQTTGQASGLGLAVRISTELVAAVLVGALIGLWLDKVFDTRPWLLLLFLLLGFGAALRNIIRVANQAERKTQNQTGD